MDTYTAYVIRTIQRDLPVAGFEKPLVVKMYGVAQITLRHPWRPDICIALPEDPDNYQLLQDDLPQFCNQFINQHGYLVLEQDPSDTEDFERNSVQAYAIWHISSDYGWRALDGRGDFNRLSPEFFGSLLSPNPVLGQPLCKLCCRQMAYYTPDTLDAISSWYCSTCYSAIGKFFSNTPRAERPGRKDIDEMLTWPEDFEDQWCSEDQWLETEYVDGRLVAASSYHDHYSYHDH